MLTCKDVIQDLLVDYLEETLSPERLRQFEEHLGVCPPCVAYLNTYRRTRDLTGQVARTPMPEELKARLRLLLLDQLRSENS